MNLIGVIEGVLFVVGDEGITLNSLSEIIDKPLEETKELLLQLKKAYEEDDRGIRISYLGDAFKLTTKKEHKEYYQRLCESEKEEGLSQSSLETLAIIAYNQPITRGEVDQARGVASSHIMRRLLLKELIAVVGKSDLPGKPNLYGTTDKFLDYFGLSDIKDLPELTKKPINKQEDEKNLFESKYTEAEK